jgi:hypothetical protein
MPTQKGRLPGQGKAFASMPEPPVPRARGGCDQSSYMLVVSLEPLETRKNQNELLLEEDALIF